MRDSGSGLFMVRLVLACVVALAACAADPSDPDDAPRPPRLEPQPDVTPAEEVRPGVRLDHLLDPAGPLDEVVDRLREPRSRDAQPIGNRHVAGGVDTVRTWRYDGLTLELYEPREGEVLLRRLDVTSDTYGTADGLAVGQTRADLESVLGVAAATNGDVVSYRTGLELPTTVAVTYEAGEDGVQRASEIEWRPPVD